MKNFEYYFSSPERRVAFIKAIDIACTQNNCNSCPAQPVCGLTPTEVKKWLNKPSHDTAPTT